MATFLGELRISSASSQSMWADQHHRSIVCHDSAEAEPIVEDSRTVATEAMKGGSKRPRQICSLVATSLHAPSLGIGVGNPLGAVDAKSGDIVTRTTSCRARRTATASALWRALWPSRRRFERRRLMRWVRYPLGAPDVVPIPASRSPRNRRRRRRYRTWPHRARQARLRRRGHMASSVATGIPLHMRRKRTFGKASPQWQRHRGASGHRGAPLRRRFPHCRKRRAARSTHHQGRGLRSASHRRTGRTSSSRHRHLVASVVKAGRMARGAERGDLMAKFPHQRDLPIVDAGAAAPLIGAAENPLTPQNLFLPGDRRWPGKTHELASAIAARTQPDVYP